MGYYMVIYLAGLQGISPELYEASELDEANTWQEIQIHYVAAASSYYILCCYYRLTIGCFKIYDTAGIVGEARTCQLPQWFWYPFIYQEALYQMEYGYASSTIILFLIVLGSYPFVPVQE